MVLDDDRQGELRALIAQGRVQRMAGGGDDDVGREHDVIADMALAVVHNGQIEIGVDVIAHMGVAAVGEVNRCLHPDGLAAGAQQPVQQLVLALYVHRTGVVVVKADFLGDLALLFDHLLVGLIFLRSMAEFDNLLNYIKANVRTSIYTFEIAIDPSGSVTASQLYSRFRLSISFSLSQIEKTDSAGNKVIMFIKN